MFSAEGRRRLRGAWMLLGISAAITAVLIVGTHAYLDKEKRDASGSTKRLQEARARLDNIKRERDNLQESAEIYRALVARGLMQGERRLDLVELLNRLRAEHHLASVDYEISPQRPLPLSGSRSFPAVDIVSSRVTLKVRALHEGDVLGFVEALSQNRQGFHPVDRCLLRRIDAATGNVTQPRVEGECTLEWITMKEKRVA
jgi:hypothetical protein